MKVGDIVSRNSYGNDMYFRIVKKLDNNTFELCGVKYRLKTVVNKDDLSRIEVNKFQQYTRNYKKDIDDIMNKILSERVFETEKTSQSGKVLHLDADEFYLSLCMKYYKKLNINAVGEHILEEQQPKVVSSLLLKHVPDILVITGHDSFKKESEKDDLNNYKNSKYFIETVKKAREVNYSKDTLVIIAGACQSYYEKLIQAGANISSSPKRIVIHALDPLLIAEKIAFTNIKDILNIKDLLNSTFSGSDGYGGIETRGIMREIYPKA